MTRQYSDGRVIRWKNFIKLKTECGNKERHLGLQIIGRQVQLAAGDAIGTGISVVSHQLTVPRPSDSIQLLFHQWKAASGLNANL